MTIARNKSFGQWGETQACAFLIRKGFKILDRNFHTPQGEIDIVARQGDDFYFIEVKTRVQGELANDLAVTKSKLRKLDKTVKSYCYKKNVTEGSFITAGLLVVLNRAKKSVSFRLAAYC